MDFQDNEINEILNIFSVESEEIIERLNNALLELEKNPTNKDLIILLFRDAHSLKGAARMIGFTTTQNLAHKMEDILGLAKENKLVLTTKIADIMYKSVDLISKIITQSIQNGKEIYSIAEVENQLNELEKIKPNNNDEILSNLESKTTNKQNEDLVLEINNRVSQKNIQEGPNRAELIRTSDRINYLIINSLIIIIKLTEKIEKELILNLLSNIDEMTYIFKKINYFEIKNILETIQLKLNVIIKCDSELTVEEVEEIQQEMDRIIKEFTTLSEINELQTVDYYSYAFDEKNYSKGTSPIDTTNSIVQNEAIIEPQKVTKFFDFENILKKLHTLEISNEYIEDLISAFKELKASNQQADFIPVLSRIIELLGFIHNKNIKTDEASLEILLNSAQYCFSLINNENPNSNPELLSQQLTVAKQLLEISGTPAQIIQPENNLSTITKNNNVKDFSKLFDSGEIKTLHVESSKLDSMVNQIGELISTKIKTTKQLSELSISEKHLEEWQKDFSKLINHMKSYEKKSNQAGKDNDSTSTIFIKQFLNSLSEQNKKLNNIITTLSKLQRANFEEDTKLRNLINDFDSMVKNIRVLPLATVFHMFGRMVRDIAKESGKEVELTITGSETSADKKIIEEIKNPLIHIIRNSIDHGIETPEIRQAKGKSPIGHLNINAKHLDNKIVIEIIDDGQGFDIEKIKEKALENGILTSDEISSMPNEDIINLVFLPGFTTGEEVTSISGRGIGMDVVKSKISQLNGSVKVLSEFDKGSCIQIELPITMATMTAFLIQSGGQNFAIPMSSINSVICKKNEEILSNNGKITVIYNDKNIPVFSLTNILNIKETNFNTTLKTIIIIEVNNKTIGIIVDKLIGEQEILHKKLSPPIFKLKNISGITTLASGETCLILNTSDIIKNTTFKNKNITSIHNNLISTKYNSFTGKKILIVDDSITTRTLEANILTNANFTVLSAINPIEAIKILNQTTVDLIITDIEMPEMNGIEFIETLKSTSAFSDIPIIVMSSLIDEKTKHQIKSLNIKNYLTKGEFNQKEFLKTITNNLSKD